MKIRMKKGGMVLGVATLLLVALNLTEANAQSKGKSTTNGSRSDSGSSARSRSQSTIPPHRLRETAVREVSQREGAPGKVVSSGRVAPQTHRVDVQTSNNKVTRVDVHPQTGRVTSVKPSPRTNSNGARPRH